MESEWYREFYKCKVCEFTSDAMPEIRSHVTLEHDKLLSKPLDPPVTIQDSGGASPMKGELDDDDQEESGDESEEEEEEEADPEKVLPKYARRTVAVNDRTEEADRKAVEKQYGIKLSASDVPGRCPVCGSDVLHLRFHVMKVHGLGEVCRQCGGRFQASRLVAHIREAHQGERAARQCRECGQFVKNIRAHNRRAHLCKRPPDDQVDTKKDDPVVKRSRLTPAEDLRAHIPEVSRDDPGTDCPYCGNGHVSKARLKVHIMSVHRPKAHVPCPVCDKLIKENILAGHIGDIHLDRKVSAPCRVKGCSETFQMDKEVDRAWQYKAHLAHRHKLEGPEARPLVEKWIRDVTKQATALTTEVDQVWRLLADKGIEPEHRTPHEVARLVIDHHIPEEHVIRPEDMMPWLMSCDVCGLDFDNVKDRNLHVVEEHRRDMEDMPRFRGNVKDTSAGFVVQCLDCNEAEFSTMSDLEKHSYDDHYEKDYVCGLCSKVLPTFNLYFKQHLRDHVSLDEEGQQVCPFCHTKWGSMKSRVYNHLSVHVPSKYWSDALICSVCGSRHSSQAQRQKHEQTDHPRELGLGPAPKHPCSHCKMVFPKKVYLAAHKRNKHGITKVRVKGNVWKEVQANSKQ